jgi:DNA-binding MarR family transcriptional regulator
MAPDPAALARAHSLSRRLIEVAERAKSGFGGIAGEFGLTAVQARTVLWLGDPRPMRDLADHLACDPSNVTGIADRLQRLGLVERVAGTDRRVKQLSLTERGSALRAELGARVASGSTVIAHLDPDEQDQLSWLLDKLLGLAPVAQHGPRS